MPAPPHPPRPARGALRAAALVAAAPSRTASEIDRALGSWASPNRYLAAANRSNAAANSSWADIGFRVARPVPEPAAAGLGLAAAAALALLRRRAAPRACRGRSRRA